MNPPEPSALDADTLRGFLRRLPKAELHVHLDGSLRMETLIDLARAANVELPAYDAADLRARVFKPAYANLPEYLTGFQYTTRVLRTAEHLERAAFELAEDNLEEGVRYLEVRFAPHLHITDHLPLRDVVRAVHRGLERARTRHQARPEVRDNGNGNGKGDIAFEYGLILCAMRAFTAETSPWFARRLAEAGPGARLRDVAEAASYELAAEAVRLRDVEGLQVVGFDLAGEESGHPAVHHRRAYQHAHNHFLRTTVHAGEDYGPESIFQALSDCHAKRIGHGTHLFAHDQVRAPDIADPVLFTRQLADYLAAERITVEVCLTSNLQTLPTLTRIEDHPVRRMLAFDIPVALCTDNRLVSGTSVSRELELAVRHLKLTAAQLRDIVLSGFRGAFFPKPFRAKRAFIESARRCYERVETELRGPDDRGTTSPERL